MRSTYVDKHEEQLREAVEKANFIPSDIRWRVDGMTYLGSVRGEYGNRHYYLDRQDNKYYYESDFDKEMRIKLRNRRTHRYVKR